MSQLDPVLGPRFRQGNLISFSTRTKEDHDQNNLNHRNRNHSCTKVLSSSSMVLGADLRGAIEHPKTCHACSMVLRAEDIRGHSSR
ncbi:hypothetical protein TNCV_3376151 [Trichonephila clavipes]|nr:hypothetical protein TNCV_3376151 [Trichonephila clavipes]